MNHFNLTSPCKDCPFRTDNGFILRNDRVAEICDSITTRQQSFPCHKTTKFDENGQSVAHDGEMYCAGAMIMLEHMNRPNQMMRIGERLGFYDHTKLNMAAPVFRSAAAMIKTYKERNNG